MPESIAKMLDAYRVAKTESKVQPAIPQNLRHLSSTASPVVSWQNFLPKNESMQRPPRLRYLPVKDNIKVSRSRLLKRSMFYSEANLTSRSKRSCRQPFHLAATASQVCDAQGYSRVFASTRFGRMDRSSRQWSHLEKHCQSCLAVSFWPRLMRYPPVILDAWEEYHRTQS